MSERAPRHHGVLDFRRDDWRAFAAAAGARERDASVVVDAAVRYAIVRIAAQSIGFVLFGRGYVLRRPEPRHRERRRGRRLRSSGQVDRPPKDWSVVMAHLMVAHRRRGAVISIGDDRSREREPPGEHQRAGGRLLSSLTF